MGLTDHLVRRDKFEADETVHDFYFPCCVCVHRHGPDIGDPCRTCDHNMNAEQDDEVSNATKLTGRGTGQND